jgi:drug/metabolite transporter (DMT)-like permease
MEAPVSYRQSERKKGRSAAKTFLFALGIVFGLSACIFGLIDIFQVHSETLWKSVGIWIFLGLMSAFLSYLCFHASLSGRV